MSRKSDLLGLILDTATQPEDDDPDFDGQGYTALQSPMSDNEADTNEDDTAFAALRDTGLSPEEAQETVDYMRPLDDEEAEILSSTPGLKGLYKVDDAEHDQWIAKKASQGYKAMDRAKEDAIYGEAHMSNEERLERSDSDSESGFGFKRAFRKIGRGLKKSMKVATFPLTKTMSLAAHFVPGRDARKARLIKNTYKKLWYEHANWLAHQDKGSGIPLKPRADYEHVSKLWAVDQMKRHKLPTNFNTSGADVLGAQILGREIMGSWAWPFGNFLNFSRTTVKDTSDKRASSPPSEHADQAQAPQMEDVNDPSLATTPDAGPPPAPDYQAPQQAPDQAPDPDSAPQPDSQGETMHGTSDDSLGAFATQILGTPAKDNPYAEQIVQVIVTKLKKQQAISPSDLGLLASAAREGNVSAQKAMVVLESKGVAVPVDTSGLDPWMYKLSPSYWFASKKKKEFIDAEKKGWMENYRLQKKLSKDQEILQQAEKAKQAHDAVTAAQAQAADTEAQLQAISDSLKGSMSGSFVGHEKITPISQVVVNALEKAGKKEIASRLYSKIKSGQPLAKDELREARQIANLIGCMRVVHGDFVDENYETYAMHGAFVGACALGGIGIAQAQNAQHGQFAASMAKKIASGQTLTLDERNRLAKVLWRQKALRKFTASLISGEAFAGSPDRKSWTKGAFVGAVKVLAPEDKKMLGTIVKLANLGNPRAQQALAALRKSGEIMGGNSFVGSGIKKFFHYATAPVWLPAKGLYKGAQALGLASKGGGSDPEKIRLARMRAAYKRRQAAAARAAAADAQSEAEQRAQQALADAADAEADASDAEAYSKEQKMRTAEAEADPDTIPVADESGTFIGATDAELDQLMKSSYAKPKHVEILKKASEKDNAKTPTGIKIKAGANLYAKSQSKNPKIRLPADKAIRIMVAKAQKGDPQALRDVNAVKAGRIAYQTKQSMAIMKNDLKVQKKKEALAAREARKAKLIAIRKRYEAGIANRLARASRKHELNKLAKVERMAAQGHPKARAFVASRVSAANKGDTKALAQVRGMQLASCARTQVTTRSEKQNMKFATAMAKRLAKNDPRAIRQLRIWQDAAKSGNPNAIRCLKRLALAGAVLTTIATGAVVLPKVIGQKSKQKLTPGTPAHAHAQKQVAQAKKKAASGAGSREELNHAAKIAHQLGDQKGAGQLANAASTAPSTTEGLKKEASRVAAAQAGNPEAQAGLNKALESAKQGDVDGINTLGHVLAVKTVDAANKGQPIPPVVAEGINLQARAKAGDVAAQETLQRVSEAATQPNPPPEATLAAAGAVAGAVIGSALIGKPQAHAELMEKVNPPIPAGEKSAAQAEVAAAVAKANDGTITAEEAVKAEKIAMRLKQPKLAAEIMAKAPPMEYDSMSSLPDEPLAPISGTWQLIKESAKALTLTTRDPFSNYKEGIASLSRTTPATSASMGWSPFRMFMKANKLAVLAPLVPAVAPIAATAAAASAVVNLAKGKKTEAKPETAPAKPTPEAETPNAPTEKITSTAAGTFVGIDKELDQLMNQALTDDQLDKIMTKTVNQGSFIELIKLMRTRDALKKHIVRRAEIGHPAALQIMKASLLADKAKAGDAQAKKAFISQFTCRPPSAAGGSDSLDQATSDAKKHQPPKAPSAKPVKEMRSEFKKIITSALKTKKMSRDDFNKAVLAHIDPKATAEVKAAAGEKMLTFLTKKGVKIG